MFWWPKDLSVNKKDQSEHGWLCCMTLLGTRLGIKKYVLAISTVHSVWFFPHKNVNPVSYARTRIQDHPPSQRKSSQRAYAVTQFISVLCRRKHSSKIPSEFRHRIIVIRLWCLLRKKDRYCQSNPVQRNVSKSIYRIA